MLKSNVRIVDVANQAGVSRAAAAMVLMGTGRGKIRVSKETAIRVRQTAEKLDYRPNRAAQQLAGKRAKMIGLLMHPTLSDLNTSRLAFMEARVRSLGYHLMVMHEVLHPTPRELQIKDCLNDFADRQVDGIICMQHMCREEPELIPQLVSSYFKNAVFIDKPAIGGLKYVGPDWVNGAKQCVRHLLDKGKQRIGLVLPDLKWYSGPMIKEGYIDQMYESQVSLDEELIWNSDRRLVDGPDLYPDEAYEIVDSLVTKRGADALIFANDYWAGQTMACLLDKGYSVPNDVAIIGFGDSHFVNYTRPLLTSVNLQTERVSSVAVEILIDMIEDAVKLPTDGLLLKPALIKRGSA